MPYKNGPFREVEDDRMFDGKGIEASKSTSWLVDLDDHVHHFQS